MDKIDKIQYVPKFCNNRMSENVIDNVAKHSENVIDKVDKNSEIMANNGDTKTVSKYFRYIDMGVDNIEFDLNQVKELTLIELGIRSSSLGRAMPTMINTQNLTMLLLSDNKIDNIEWLSTMALDSLTVLDLENNKMTNIQPLAKTYLPGFGMLLMMNNLILSYDSLTRVHWGNRDQISQILLFSKDITTIRVILTPQLKSQLNQDAIKKKYSAIAKIVKR